MSIILGVLGPAGSLASAAFGAFEFAERIASKDAKIALTQQIKMLDFDSASILSEGATEIFRKVFTDRHFSLRCFWRSAAFSILGILLLGTIYYIIHPTELASDLDVNGRKLLFVFTVGSIPAAYLTLYKTRVFLSFLSTQAIRSSLFFVVIIAIDFFITCLVYILVWLITMYVGYLLQAPAGVPFTYLWWIQKITADLFNEAIWFNEFTGVLFYAGMLPSLWLWLCHVGPRHTSSTTASFFTTLVPQYR
jgi:hypothetical protein